MKFYDDEQRTTGELFEEFFPGRDDVKRLLMEPIAYANGSTLNDPAITFGIVFSNFMSKGVYTFTGGTDKLVISMFKELRKNGVDIRRSSLVENLEIENENGERKIRGVTVSGQFIGCDAVLSNANLKNTIFKLAGKEHFSPDFIEEADAVRLNSSSCQVYLGLKKNEMIPDIGDLIFTSGAEK